MTGPVRSNPNNQTPRPTTPAQTTPPAGGGDGRTLAGLPGLGRAPSRASTQAGEGSSSSGRTRLPAPTGPGGTQRALSSQAGASSSTPSRTTIPAPARTQLTHAAERLADLEKKREALSARLDEAKQTHRASAVKSGNAQSRTELNKLQDRINHAAGQLQRLRVGRAEQLGKLEKAERLLASCERSLERSLQNLSISETSTAPAEATAVAVASTATTSAETAAPVTGPRISQEEVELKARVAQLEREADIANSGKARAQQALVAARNHVAQVEAAAARILEPESYLDVVDEGSGVGVNGYLSHVGLPMANVLPARGEADPRHAAFREHFTETDAAGHLRLRADAMEDPRLAFTAMSAFFGSLSSSHVTDGLLVNLLRGDHWDMSEITNAMRNGGEGLEAAVRLRIHMGWEQMTGLADLAAQAAEQAPRGRRHGRLMGTNVRRSEVVEIGQRNRQLLQLQEQPFHRATLIDGAVTYAMSMLRGVMQNHGTALGLVAEAKAQFEQTKQGLRPAFVRSLEADQALEGARTQLRQVTDERRRNEAAAAREASHAAAQARADRSDEPAPAGIPSTSATPVDEEARQLKLRGDILKHTETAETARQRLSGFDQDIRDAEGALRRAEDQFESADAAQARGREGARRQHTAQREEIAQLRQELAELDEQVTACRRVPRSSATPPGSGPSNATSSPTTPRCERAPARPATRAPTHRGQTWQWLSATSMPSWPPGPSSRSCWPRGRAPTSSAPSPTCPTAAA
jgi:hypothetical protein